jgi:hypothetical protein
MEQSREKVDDIRTRDVCEYVPVSPKSNNVPVPLIGHSISLFYKVFSYITVLVIFSAKE